MSSNLSNAEILNILLEGRNLEDFTSRTKIPLDIHQKLSGRGNAKAKLSDNSVTVNGNSRTNF